jgi:hypothetical protein
VVEEEEPSPPILMMLPGWVVVEVEVEGIDW